MKQARPSRALQDNQRAQDISDVHWLATVVNVLTLWCLAENFKEKSAISECRAGKSEWLSAIVDGFFLFETARI